MPVCDLLNLHLNIDNFGRPCWKSVHDSSLKYPEANNNSMNKTKYTDL